MSYEDLMRHPELLEDLLRRARCERAETMYRLLVLPVKRLFGARPRPVSACAAGSY